MWVIRDKHPVCKVCKKKMEWWFFGQTEFKCDKCIIEDFTISIRKEFK